MKKPGKQSNVHKDTEPSYRFIKLGSKTQLNPTVAN